MNHDRENNKLNIIPKVKYANIYLDKFIVYKVTDQGLIYCIKNNVLLKIHI